MSYYMCSQIIGSHLLIINHYEFCPINKLVLRILYSVSAARYIYLIVFFFLLSYDCEKLMFKYNV